MISVTNTRCSKKELTDTLRFLTSEVVKEATKLAPSSTDIILVTLKWRWVENGTDTFISILAKVVFRLLCLFYKKILTGIVCKKLYYQFVSSFLNIAIMQENLKGISFH
jgi:hypothetical protein